MSQVSPMWNPNQLAAFHNRLREGLTITFKYRRDGGQWKDATATVGKPVAPTRNRDASGLTYPLIIDKASNSTKRNIIIMFGIPMVEYQFTDMVIKRKRTRNLTPEEEDLEDDDMDYEDDSDVVPLTIPDTRPFQEDPIYSRSSYDTEDKLEFLSAQLTSLSQAVAQLSDKGRYPRHTVVPIPGGPLGGTTISGQPNCLYQKTTGQFEVEDLTTWTPFLRGGQQFEQELLLKELLNEKMPIKTQNGDTSVEFREALKLIISWTRLGDRFSDEEKANPDSLYLTAGRQSLRVLLNEYARMHGVDHRRPSLLGQHHVPTIRNILRAMPSFRTVSQKNDHRPYYQQANRTWNSSSAAYAMPHRNTQPSPPTYPTVSAYQPRKIR